jgi:hypothetical protein
LLGGGGDFIFGFNSCWINTNTILGNNMSQ